MAVKFVEDQSRDLRRFDADDFSTEPSEAQLHQVAEVFNTPLVGSYNWDYTIQDNRITKLYELGKELNWNGSIDLDWSIEVDKSQYPGPADMNPFVGYAPFEALTEEQKIEFAWHEQSSGLSQFLHGEQGALLVASQLVSCAPTFNAKLYAASQTFDEARHVEVFNRYLQTKSGIMYPCNKVLKTLLDKILSDPRWDLKFIGMQIIIEGLALAAFNATKLTTYDPLLKQLVHYVIRDEARHVTFGVNYLEEFVKTLSEEEIEERAEFAYEACVLMRTRLLPEDVYRHYGWDVEEAKEIAMNGKFMLLFRNMLFSRVVPNLKRIGLLTDKVRPKFEELGILEYEDFKDDGTISWTDLEKPLETREQIWEDKSFEMPS